jgi:serine acetyltransferase
MDIIQACLIYTLRVLAAWWFIRLVRNKLQERFPACPTWIIFYVSVFIGAELTFVADYYIFKGMVFHHEETVVNSSTSSI